jgi:high mobility group protein 2-like 1
MPKTKNVSKKRVKEEAADAAEPNATEPAADAMEQAVDATDSMDVATDVSTNVGTDVVVDSSSAAPAATKVKKRGVKGKIDKNEKKRKSGTRTPSSYVLFSMEYRKTVSAESPDLSLGEVSKKCGEAWGQLSVDDKAVWKEKADKCKAEKVALQKLENPEATTDKPKRKPSSYLCFSMEYRKKVIEENATLSLGDISKRCGAAWKELPEEEKEMWKKKAAEM